MPVICKCGQEEFDDSDDSYCCVSLSKTEACLKGPDGNVTCPKGDKRKFYQPCHNQCPINVQSNIAVEWNCSQFGSGGQCPPGDFYSKVCVNDEPSSNPAMANKSFEESFCNQGTSCPSNSDMLIKQCFFKRCFLTNTGRDPYVGKHLALRGRDFEGFRGEPGKESPPLRGEERGIQLALNILKGGYFAKAYTS